MGYQGGVNCKFFNRGDCSLHSKEKQFLWIRYNHTASCSVGDGRGIMSCNDKVTKYNPTKPPQMGLSDSEIRHKEQLKVNNSIGHKLDRLGL